MFLNRWSSIVTRQPCIPVLPHVTPGPLPVAVSLSFDKNHLASWKSLKLSHKKRQLQQAVLLVNLACTNKILKRLTDQLILWYFEETILGPHTPLVIVSIAFPFPPPPARPFSVRPSSFPWRQFRSVVVETRWGSRRARQPFLRWVLVGVGGICQISSCFVSFLNTKKINKN